MRKVNILKLRETFETSNHDRTRLARGTVFHIAPSNVDTIFVYSWFLSMLTGNKNIVRISSEAGEQLEQLIGIINDLSCETRFTEIRERYLIIQYERNDDITGHLSSLCDVRVIWGGDETVRRIRAIPLAPTATELIFADKFSFALINAAAFLDSNKQDVLCDGFRRDAYTFDQNACSSPRLVVWLGEESQVERARQLFWDQVEKSVMRTVDPLAPAIAVDKLVAGCSLAINSDSNIVLEQSRTTRISRIWLESPNDVNRETHCGGGLFYELAIERLADLANMITRKDQTVAVFGIDPAKLREFFATARPPGVSRVVPIGRALEFSAVWDGYDLLREFTREIEIIA